jgi:hypothetical protein
MTDHPRSLFVTVAFTWLYDQIHANSFTNFALLIGLYYGG